MAKAIAQLTTSEFQNSYGQISYNTIPFGVFRKDMKIRGVPQYDDAGRVVTHVQYHLMIHTIIQNDSLTNQQLSMGDLQDKLSEPGKVLKIEDVGFDKTLTTDLEGTKPDLLWGAKPRLIECQPAAGISAWEVVWEVEFNVSRSGSPGRAWMAFNYDVTYDLDENGLTTRTIEGHIQLPATRYQGSESRTVQVDLEGAFDNLTVAMPAGFKRRGTMRKLNAARNRLNFRITDVEIDGEAYPEGIIEADIDYDFENKPPGFNNWSATLAGTLTVAPGYPPSLAALKFFTILFHYVAKLRKTAKKPKGKGQQNGLILPIKIAMSRKLFKRTSRFRVTFEMYRCLEEILSSSGVWEPIGTDYSRWKTSMDAASVFGRRGRAELRFNAKDDSLVDVAANITAASIGNDSQRKIESTYKPSMLFSCDEVKEDNSYLHWQQEIRPIKRENLAIHQLVKTVSNAGNAIALGLNGFPQQALGFLIQKTSEPEIMVLVVGRGMRLKYAPEPMPLKDISGIPVTELARTAPAATLKASFFGCPLYFRQWTILYRVMGTPEDLPEFSKDDEKHPAICNH